MIDWVDATLKPWGRQVRWVYLAKDGWPSRTVLGKLIEEGIVGASTSQMVQHTPEVLNETAAETNRIVKHLNEQSQIMLFVHYVVSGKSKVKAATLGWQSSTYWYRLDKAHRDFSSLSTRLDKIGTFSPSIIGQKVAVFS